MAQKGPVSYLCFMITIKLGGFPFRFPQRWDEVKPSQAAALYNTRPEEIHKRLTILGGVPGSKYITLPEDVLLAAYEVISFVEDIPDLTRNSLGDFDIANDFTFLEFENARQAILAHQNELGISMYRLAEIKRMESTYVEAGAKILDGINSFLQQWGIFDIEEDSEPSALEEAAGIDRVQRFGVYSLLEAIAEKFGKFPDEIEKKPVGWVYTQYHFDREVQRYRENYQKLSGGKV